MTNKKRDWRKEPPHCRHCGGLGVLMTGKELYPHRPDLAKKLFWKCAPCDAYVGTHVGSKHAAPLGLMATYEHRQLKMNAHRLFDEVWKSGIISRSGAYKWLGEQLKETRPVHIGWSDVQVLKKIIAICETTNWDKALG